MYVLGRCGVGSRVARSGGVGASHAHQQVVGVQAGGWLAGCAPMYLNGLFRSLSFFMQPSITCAAEDGP